MTDYELAHLRLMAFRLLDGWGTRNEKNEFRVHDLTSRKATAEDLVRWAMLPPKEQP